MSLPAGPSHKDMGEGSGSLRCPTSLVSPPLTGSRKRAWLLVTTELGWDFLILLALSFGGHKCLKGTSSSRTGSLGPLT